MEGEITTLAELRPASPTRGSHMLISSPETPNPGLTFLKSCYLMLRKKTVGGDQNLGLM